MESSKTRSRFPHLMTSRVTVVDSVNIQHENSFYCSKSNCMFCLSIGTAINSRAEEVRFGGKENSGVLVSALFEITWTTEPVRRFITPQLFFRQLHCGVTLCREWLGQMWFSRKTYPGRMVFLVRTKR